MNIAVVGLGIIGGSFCKAFKKYTNHHIIGRTEPCQRLKKLLTRAQSTKSAPPKRLAKRI